MDDDVAQGPGQSHVLRSRRECVVRLRVVWHEDEVLILSVLDQRKLQGAHFPGEAGEVVPSERVSQVLEADFSAPIRFEVDHCLSNASLQWRGGRLCLQLPLADADSDNMSHAESGSYGLSVPQISRAAVSAGWLGVLAIAMAAISVVMLVTFMSISGPIPKAIAYGSNSLYVAYSYAPLVSAIAGLLSVVLAVIALRGSSRSLAVGLAGAAIGIVVFFFITGLVANAMNGVAQPPIEAKGVQSSNFPSIGLSPPVVGIAGVAIPAAVVLSRLRGVSGQRLAIAGLITGGVVTAYWLFSLLILNLGGD